MKVHTWNIKIPLFFMYVSLITPIAHLKPFETKGTSAHKMAFVAHKKRNHLWPTSQPNIPPPLCPLPLAPPGPLDEGEGPPYLSP